MKQIKNYPGYFITNDGKVFSKGGNSYLMPNGGERITKDRWLKLFRYSRRGYLGVTLCNQDGQKHHSIHRLVAEAYIPNPKNLPCTNHLNGIKTDNRVENLEWCTYSENNFHKADVLKKNIGVDVNHAKLTEQQVREIRTKYIPFVYTQSRLADEYNVSQPVVSNIVTKKSWKQLI